MISPDDRDLLQAYIDGELPPEPTAALEARLRAEPSLADGSIMVDIEVGGSA